MYDSIDVIPAKIYFKILETGDISLLSKEEEDAGVLALIWELIEAQHEELTQGKEEKKVLDLSKSIESLASRYESIRIAVYYLRREHDQELFDLLVGKGFNLDGDIQEALDRVDRESEGIIAKIERLSLKIPKINKESSAKTNFDKVVLSYGAITGLGFVDTNNITITQYYALIETGNEKIKALEGAANKNTVGSKR